MGGSLQASTSRQRLWGMVFASLGAGTNASGQSRAAITVQGTRAGRAMPWHLSPPEHFRTSTVEGGDPRGQGLTTESPTPDTAQGYSGWAISVYADCRSDGHWLRAFQSPPLCSATERCSLVHVIVKQPGNWHSLCEERNSEPAVTCPRARSSSDSGTSGCCTMAMDSCPDGSRRGWASTHGPGGGSAAAQRPHSPPQRSQGSAEQALPASQNSC